MSVHQYKEKWLEKRKTEPYLQGLRSAIYRNLLSLEAIQKKSNDNAYSCMLKEMDLDA
jgi:hypothetical protein